LYTSAHERGILMSSLY